MKISYAQNYEDILVDRLFSEKKVGFYIDVGAAHPRKDSVTKFFYDRGWSGINIEPNEHYFSLLKKERNRDVNLWCALSDQDGELSYFYVEEDPKISFIGNAQDLNSSTYKGLTIKEKLVDVKKLSTLCAEHSVKEIDFLKIDVEGAEEQVLRGMSFSKIQPRLIIIESVVVKGLEQVSHEWAKIIEDNGYVQAYFDGINSYFVKEEDREALSLYSVPLNASDNFIKFQYTRPKFLIKRLFSNK